MTEKDRLCNRADLLFGERNHIRHDFAVERVEIDRITVVAFVFFIDDKPVDFIIDCAFHFDKILLAVGIRTKSGFVNVFCERFQLSRGAEKVYAVRRADVDVSADNDNPQYCHYNHKSYNKISYCFHNFSPSPTVRTAYVYSVYRNNIFSILYEFSKNCKSILQSGFSTPFSSNRI